MCQVQFKTDELKPCRCGFKPDHYTIGYGQTPYDVFCPNCKKQTTLAKCKVTGWNGNLFDYWNNHIAQMTLEEIDHEVEELRKEQKANCGYDGYKVYEYYWEKGKGEIFFGKC
jgi:hypothetical protein